MKKTIFVLILITTSLILQAQETVGNRTFNVGDTLTMANGANANGDFISANLIMAGGLAGYEKMPASYAGQKMIIKKLKWQKKGQLNEALFATCNIGAGVTASIHLQLALKKNEIE